MMRRSSRVHLHELNTGKAQVLTDFLRLCHDATQYFIDLFWQRQDFSAELADLETIHRGCDRFALTTRLAQALAKQAKEILRAQTEKKQRKPRLRCHTVTLYYHFVKIEPFQEGCFDWAVVLTGSGAPRMVVPVKSTTHLNKLLSDGWQMANGNAMRTGHGQCIKASDHGRMPHESYLVMPSPSPLSRGVAKP